MATGTGARGTLSIEQSQRKIDMAAGIALLEPDATPLTTITQRIGRKVTVNPEFSWLEDALDPRYDQINGAHDNAVTTIAVDNGPYYAEHDIFQITRTGETLRVTAVAGNNLTVAPRGSVGSPAAAINDNDEIVILGSAQPEGDTSKPARWTNPVKTRNYTQILRRPVEETGTLRATESAVGQDDWDLQTRKAGIEHKKDIELTFIHGRPSENTSGSQPRRTTGGVFAFLTENQLDAGGAFTEAELNTHLRQVMRYGSKNKLMLGSGIAVSMMNTFPAGKLQWRQDDQTYGINVSQFQSPFGRVQLVYHPLLEGSRYGGYLVTLDIDELKYRFLRDRDSHVRTNIQAPDADTRKDEWLTEAGLQMGAAKAHGLVTGITES